jgi:valyl-tRNA synthetase
VRVPDPETGGEVPLFNPRTDRWGNHFAWDEVCDWYVELAKTPLAAGGRAAEATRLVLGHVLDRLLRLLHPITPFVTEELWTALVGDQAAAASSGAGTLAGDSEPTAPFLVIADWPVADPARRDPRAEAEVAAVQTIVTEIRRFRAEQGLAPGRQVPAKIEYANDAVVGVSEHEAHVRSLARLGAIGEAFAATAALTTSGVRIELDLHGVIDVPAERARLAKALAAAQKDLGAARAKLADPDFTGKAPERVVAKTCDRAAAAEADIARIIEQIASLPDR